MTEKKQIDQITTIIEAHLIALQAPGGIEANFDGVESLTIATAAYLKSRAPDETLRRVPNVEGFSQDDLGRLGRLFILTFSFGFNAGRRTADAERLELMAHANEE